MRIANVMFSRGLGGIEQAFLDYNDALLAAGNDVLALTHPLAEINTRIRGELQHQDVSNLGGWDPLAVRRIREIYREWQPDAVISHGNRALTLNHRAKGNAFHIGVTHNYHLQHFHKLDGVFATTTHLAEAAQNAQVVATKIAMLPNMIHLPEPLPLRENPQPVVIGALGRLIEKKGFHCLLDAAALLAKKQIPFRLRIGGKGEWEERLIQQTQALELTEQVEFIGWVEDKTAFFREIDVFCLPSLHEPFGIVLLEAMAYQRPVAAFASEGPAEIIQSGEALLAPVGDVSKLAEALGQLITDATLRNNLAAQGRILTEQRYALPVISTAMQTALKGWLPLEAPLRHTM